MIKHGVLAVVAAIACAACSTTGRVVTGNVRPATSPEAVKVYSKPPAHYEEIAQVQANSSQSWGAFSMQHRVNVVLERLKEEAAKVGANGIILGEATEDAGGGSALRTGNATAIYVPPEG